jgi:hypothetical protein
LAGGSRRSCQTFFDAATRLGFETLGPGNVHGIGARRFFFFDPDPPARNGVLTSQYGMASDDAYASRHAGIYNERKVNLIGTLKTDVTSVCLTYDIWAGKAKEDYLSVVAHFVNSHWEIEKGCLV